MPNKICSIEGCGKRHYGRGWCSIHYTRWLRHGDPRGRPTKQNEAYSTELDNEMRHIRATLKSHFAVCVNPKCRCDLVAARENRPPKMALDQDS